MGTIKEAASQPVSLDLTPRFTAEQRDGLFGAVHLFEDEIRVEQYGEEWCRHTQAGGAVRSGNILIRPTTDCPCGTCETDR